MIETEFGLEAEDGQVLAYKEKFAFLNLGRKEEFKKPILKNYAFVSKEVKGE
jgi:hypothetical protein